MANSAAQNPSNKVGRNSGAGAGGVSEIVPTEAESRRGVSANVSGGSTFDAGAASGGGVGSLAKLGLVGAVGAGIAAVVTRRVRRPRSRMERLREYVGLGR